jgi:hypothetical protein
MGKCALSSILGLSFLLYSGALSADADCPKTPGDIASTKALAGELFAEGQKLFQRKQFEKAVSVFLCSLRLVEHENTVFNIAACLKNTPQKKTTLVPLREYVRDNPAARSSMELRALIRHVETAWGQPPSNLPEAPSQPPKDSTEPSLPEEADTSFQPLPYLHLPETQETAAPPVKQTRKILGWAAIALGAASVITAPVLLGLSLAAKDEANTTAQYADFEEARSRMHDLRMGGWITLSLGAALMATGAILLPLPGRNDSSEKTSPELSLGFFPNGMAWTGRF